jgi:hypothetical protein
MKGAVVRVVRNTITVYIRIADIASVVAVAIFLVGAAKPAAALFVVPTYPAVTGTGETSALQGAVWHIPAVVEFVGHSVPIIIERCLRRSAVSVHQQQQAAQAEKNNCKKHL